MKLTPEYKKLMLQPVHCTGYLAAAHGVFHLHHNNYDNKWYYRMNNNRDLFAGIATENCLSWKHNPKYEFKEKEFSGVIVKIDRILLSTILGIYKREPRQSVYAYDYQPSKHDGFAVIAATVYFRNGCKRIVPLDCIQEAKEFSNGKDTKLLMHQLELLVENQSENIITFHEDGLIEIENMYYGSISPATDDLITVRRYLVLNVQKRYVSFFGCEGNEWFNISDDEYNKILSVMHEQMKEECGFIPELSYGENNFDRLVNYARFPFAPELNELCKEEVIGPLIYKTEDGLKRSSDGVKKFIKLTGLPYTPKINKLFLQGHRTFLEYLNIWSMGFRDETVIEQLMDADSHKIFSTAYSYERSSVLAEDIAFLFQFYDEKTVSKLLCEDFSSDKDYYSTSDALQYMKLLKEEEYLPQNVIAKIRKEGFTDYNHNLLMRTYNQLHSREECFENKDITYTDEERSLEWENGGYKFCLPEDTSRLVDIGSNMNICVGHLYRDKAVKKECTIVYATKGEEYELCIELSKHNNRFRLVQRSAFNNKDPRGNDMAIFKQWCRVKGVS